VALCDEIHERGGEIRAGVSSTPASAKAVAIGRGDVVPT
jgi:hypothetical protein